MPFDVKVTTRLNLSRPSLDNFLNSPDGDVGRELSKRGRIIVTAAKRQVGVDTGRLRESISMRHERVGAFQQIVITANASHALVHHEGSRPHVITPNGPNLLRFQSKGRVIYTKEVLHPGTKPNKFLSDNLHLAFV